MSLEKSITRKFVSFGHLKSTFEELKTFDVFSFHLSELFRGKFNETFQLEFDL